MLTAHALALPSTTACGAKPWAESTVARVDQTPLEVGEPDTQHQGTRSSSAAAMLTEACAPNRSARLTASKWFPINRSALGRWSLRNCFHQVMEGHEVRSAEATSTNEFPRLQQSVGSLG